MSSLRPYQKKAVSKMMWAMKMPGNDIISLPTGAGKTHVIAEFVKELGKPLLILVPSKELLEQDLEKLKAVVPENEIGIYSASMNSKEVKKYTLATIQSAYKNPEKFAHYSVTIIDECDLLNPKKVNSMYGKFFKAIGNPKIYGLTATPWRQAIIYERWGREKWMLNSITTTKMIQRIMPFVWKRMLMVVNTHDLINQGYLTPLKYHDIAVFEHESIPTNKSKSDFDLVKYEEMLAKFYEAIADKIKEIPHKSKLVFCATITQAEELQKEIPYSIVVTSKTKKKIRSQAVDDFRSGKIKVLLNVGIYTVGFDYPKLDCIVLLRPTRSLRLHCQMLGRLTRKADDKEFGHVYDFAGNISSLGKLEDIVITRIENKWNVVSPAYPDGFHYQPLYKYKLRKPK